MFPQWLKDRLIFKPNKKLENASPQLKEVVYPETTCEHCTKTITQASYEIRLYKATNQQQAHIKTKCNNCGFYKNPCSSAYDCTRIDLVEHYKVKKEP